MVPGGSGSPPRQRRATAVARRPGHRGRTAVLFAAALAWRLDALRAGRVSSPVLAAVADSLAALDGDAPTGGGPASPSLDRLRPAGGRSPPPPAARPPPRPPGAAASVPAPGASSRAAHVGAALPVVPVAHPAAAASPMAAGDVGDSQDFRPPAVVKSLADGIGRELRLPSSSTLPPPQTPDPRSARQPSRGFASPAASAEARHGATGAAVALVPPFLPTSPVRLPAGAALRQGGGDAAASASPPRLANPTATLFRPPSCLAAAFAAHPSAAAAATLPPCFCGGALAIDALPAVPAEAFVARSAPRAAAAPADAGGPRRSARLPTAAVGGPSARDAAPSFAPSPPPQPMLRSALAPLRRVRSAGTLARERRWRLSALWRRRRPHARRRRTRRLPRPR